MPCFESEDLHNNQYLIGRGTIIGITIRAQASCILDTATQIPSSGVSSPKSNMVEHDTKDIKSEGNVPLDEVLVG